MEWIYSFANINRMQHTLVRSRSLSAPLPSSRRKRFAPIEKVYEEDNEELTVMIPEPAQDEQQEAA